MSEVPRIWDEAGEPTAVVLSDLRQGNDIVRVEFRLRYSSDRRNVTGWFYGLAEHPDQGQLLLIAEDNDDGTFHAIPFAHVLKVERSRSAWEPVELTETDSQPSPCEHEWDALGAGPPRCELCGEYMPSVDSQPSLTERIDKWCGDNPVGPSSTDSRCECPEGPCLGWATDPKDCRVEPGPDDRGAE